MSGLIWWGVLATYVVGIFPGAVQAVRRFGDSPRCHGEDSPTTMDKYPHRTARWCSQFHHRGCTRSDGELGLRDLKFAAIGFTWPILLLGIAVLAQASSGRLRPLYSDAELARIERELGLGDHR